MKGGLGLTSIEAVGVVRAQDFSLDVEMVSGDLRDLAFLGLDLSGSGTFDGLLSGEMSRPEAAGVFSLERYDLDGWMVDRIAGNIDFSGDRVSLESVNVFEGNSRVVLDGDLDLATRQPHLDVEVAALDPSDLDTFFSVPIAGTVTGQLHVDSVETGFGEWDSKRRRTCLRGSTHRKRRRRSDRSRRHGPTPRCSHPAGRGGARG